MKVPCNFPIRRTAWITTSVHRVFLQKRIQGPDPPFPLPPRFFFQIMQFSGNFKGKTPVLSKFWAQAPLGVKIPLPKSWIRACPFSDKKCIQDAFALPEFEKKGYAYIGLHREAQTSMIACHSPHARISIPEVTDSFCSVPPLIPQRTMSVGSRDKERR